MSQPRAEDEPPGFGRFAGRLHAEGIPLRDLELALRTPRIIGQARRDDRCLLCFRNRVNEAGLCEACYAALDGEGARLAARWLAGQAP